MKNKTRSCIFLCICSFLFGCTGIPKKTMHTAVLAPELIQYPGQIQLMAAELLVQHADALSSSGKSLGKMLTPLGRKYGLSIQTDDHGRTAHHGVQGEGNSRHDARPGESPLRLELEIREEKFLKSLETWYAQTATAALFQVGTDTRALSLVYVEETTQPLRNSYHLYTILNTVLEEIANVLHAPEE